MRQRFILLLGLFLVGFGITETIGYLTLSFKGKQPIQTTQTKPAEVISSPVPSATPVSQDVFVVSRVIDGDTIELTSGQRVRYIGVDTPESVDPRRGIECYGPEAKLKNTQFVEGKSVRLEKDVSETDVYGRLLRYVYVGDTMINEALVRSGYAHASTYPPDVKYQERFRLAEQQAREASQGLWKDCTTEFTPVRMPTERTEPIVQGVSASGCDIKGNISGDGTKIYHARGCSSYDNTSINEERGERWFCTEDDAVKAGWRKAKNC